MDEKNRICLSQRVACFIKKLFGDELVIMAWRDRISQLGYKIVLVPKFNTESLISVCPDKYNRITIPQEIMKIPSFSGIKNKKRQVECCIESNKKLIIIRF